MTEDSCIFLVSRRVRCDLAKFQMISGVCRLQKHDAIFCLEMFLYRIESFFCLCCQFFPVCTSADLCKFPAIFYKHCHDKYRLCHRSLRRSCRLERFTRLTGEAVQVQTVIPVRPSDQWKSVRSKMCHSKLERPVQMLKQRLFGSLFAVKRHWLIQDLIITRLFDVCRHCRDQPQQGIVKSTSNSRPVLQSSRRKISRTYLLSPTTNVPA